MTKHPKELSKETIEEFARLVGQARVNYKDSIATIMDGGSEHVVRIKRAESMANQIQVWRGEPIVVHVPDGENGDRWYVLPVSWQMRFAKNNAIRSSQHASHAFDCMMVSSRELPEKHKVDPKELASKCMDAIREASNKTVRLYIKAITRARSAVADALISAIEEELFDTDDA